MYWRDKWEFINSIEYEYKYPGRYGAKGEKRGKKKKLTPEQVKKQNQINRENRMRRMIKKNFYPEDLWVTLKYPKGQRPGTETAKEDLHRFLASVRKKYRRRGEDFKFIYRMEVGKLGGIHIHLLVNRICADTDLLLQKSWKQGRIHFENIHEYGGYKKLAEYIVKQPEEEWEQLSFLSDEERKALIRYSASRNLIRPDPERKVCRGRTMKKLKENGPVPTPGFYIDKNSVICGTNPYTGMSYFKYTECRIKEISRKEEQRDVRGHLRRNQYKRPKKTERDVYVPVRKPGEKRKYKR